MVGSYPGTTRVEKPIRTTRRQRVSEFADYTGVSGVFNLKRSKSWFRKSVWFVLWLTVWIICIWQATGSVKKYLEYPVNVIVSISYDDQADFPAVTICNLNPIRKYGNVQKCLPVA